MGCGCKKKKAQGVGHNSTPVTDAATERRKEVAQEQKEYQDKVKFALRQLMEIKQRKRRIKR
jgi:uncharacterized membrane protein